jgi:DNA processing protein
MSSPAKNRDEILIDVLTLYTVNGIGVNRFYQLVKKFGGPGRVLRQTRATLTDLPGIGDEIAAAVTKRQNRADAEKAVREISKRGWKYFLYSDPDYPEPLKNIDDPPPFIFYTGDYLETDHNAVAVVGSRTATEEGRHFTVSLARDLAQQGVTVISGMARGIDTCAHRGAITGNGRTIAVFGSSLDIIYPPENRELAAEIIKRGCIFSEYLPQTEPFAANFTSRNRIISGLAQAVVIIEAAERSGALSTAGHALKQNREVFAVPGSPAKTTSIGTNSLIKKGARLLTSTLDIFDELPRLKSGARIERAGKLPDLTKTEKEIINLFTDRPVHIDNISRLLEQPVSEIMPILLALELKGIIKELSGKRFMLE